MILAQYCVIITNMQANDITKGTDPLIVTCQLLQRLTVCCRTKDHCMTNVILTYLIQTNDVMSQGWQNHLKAVGDKDILTHLDNLICKSVAFMIP